MKDGTKIRRSVSGNFNADFPESIDMKITNYCDLGCAFCHEMSTKRGNHANFETIKKRLEGLPAGVEIAIGGGNPLDYYKLLELLKWMYDRDLIANMTVNSKHLVIDKYKNLMNEILRLGYIYGLGISGDTPNSFETLPNVVNHFIAGEQTLNDLKSISKRYKKVLILGYKDYGRGFTYEKSNRSRLDSNIIELNSYLRHSYKGPKHIYEQLFEIISFDNLAIKQLNIQNIMGKDFEDFYMGDDGKFTMYFDAVADTYAKSSTSTRINFTDFAGGYQQNVRDGFVGL